ncbi:MAG: hypothetical protein AB1466_04570 [Actinomycetota bacterium]
MYALKTLKRIALTVMLILILVALGLLAKPWKIEIAPSTNIIDTSVKGEAGSSIGVSTDAGTHESDATPSKASSSQPAGENPNASQRTTVTTSVSKSPMKTQLQRREYVLPEQEPAVDKRYDPPKKEVTSDISGDTSEDKGNTSATNNLNDGTDYNVPTETIDHLQSEIPIGTDLLGAEGVLNVAD